MFPVWWPSGTVTSTLAKFSVGDLPLSKTTLAFSAWVRVVATKMAWREPTAVSGAGAACTAMSS